MAEFNLGPISLRAYSGQNWSHFEVALVSDRNGGKARRETAVRAGFKSTHLIEAAGKDNPADRFVTPDGSVVFGKIVQTATGGIHVLSAEEVYTRGLYLDAVKNGLTAAQEATALADEQKQEATTAA